jgi:hypothetical protein
MTAFSHYNDRRNLGGINCRDYEIVPGLAVDAAVTTCLNELNQHAASAEHSVRILTALAEMALQSKQWWKATKEEGQQEQQPMWKDLPVERRAKVALAIVGFIRNNGIDGTIEYFGGKIPVPMDACNTLFKTVCGMTNPPNMDLCKSVFEKASADELLGPEEAGGNYCARAFFYFLLGRGGDYSDLNDIVAKIKEFENITLIPGPDRDIELAKEKFECLKLSRGKRKVLE